MRVNKPSFASSPQEHTQGRQRKTKASTYTKQDNKRVTFDENTMSTDSHFKRRGTPYPGAWDGKE